MQSPKKKKRRYAVSDPSMLRSSSTLQGLFEQDLAAFGGFDADFNTAFAEQWRSDIDAAYTLPTDETLQDQLTQLTEDRARAALACRDKWSEVKFFMQKAFPTSKGIWVEFGASNYKKARGTIDGTLKFMTVLHEVAMKYSAELIAAGYSLQKMEEIRTLHDNLQAIVTDREVFKEARSTETERRIDALNKPYDALAIVCAAAPMVFPDSAAKQKQYVFAGKGG